MDAELIARLLNKASRLGGQQMEVIGWIPPQTEADEPDGKFVIRQHATPARGSDSPWWSEKR